MKALIIFTDNNGNDITLMNGPDLSFDNMDNIENKIQELLYTNRQDITTVIDLVYHIARTAKELNYYLQILNDAQQMDNDNCSYYTIDIFDEID